MNATRRACIASIGAGVAGGGLLSRRTKAQTTVSISGGIESAIGASLEGSLIEFVAPEAQIFEKVPIEDGGFEATLEGDVRYHVTFWHETERGDYRAESDGVPLHYDLEQDLMIEEENVDLGAYEIPEGHEIQVRFEDPNGDPVEGLHVGFRTSGGSGTGPQSFFTDADGYVYHEAQSDPGVELAGEIRVEVLSPTDHTDVITPRRLSVTDQTEATIALTNPEAWGGTVVGSGSGSGSGEPSGSDTETDATPETPDGDGTAPSTDTRAGTQSGEREHRGFFTNDPESSVAFLNDPVAITWGGILVSIVGITMQLLGGD